MAYKGLMFERNSFSIYIYLQRPWIKNDSIYHICDPSVYNSQITPGEDQDRPLDSPGPL